MYRACVIEFDDALTKRWDNIVSNVIFIKCGLEPRSGKNYPV